MNYIDVATNFIGVLGGLIFSLWRSGSYHFFIALITGGVLAGLVWWLSSLLAYGFNRQFSLHTKHKIYCGIAAAITLCFTVLFFALQYAEDVAEHIVSTWGQAIKVDSEWGTNTFQETYEAVYALRKPSGEQLEDFSSFPHPKTGKTRIPTTHKRSIELAAKTYAQAATDHFRNNNSLLSLILWASSSDAEESISMDMGKEFAVRETYPASAAIELAEKRIQKRLKEQLPRIVFISRIALVLLFILIQAIVLTLLVRAALADIKVRE